MIQQINQNLTYAASDGYFGATNLGGFSAAIYASYWYNGQYFAFSSGMFTLFIYKEIKIPEGATDIHLYALIANGLGQWTPVYNNNFSTAGMIELKLGGTIWDPYAIVIQDPDATKTKILATNNAAFIARYTIGYTCGKYIYSMESQNFSFGMSREIAFPNLATNISIKAEFFTGSKWINFYNNNIPKISNINLTFTGDTTNPKYDEKITPPSSGGNGTVQKKAILICSKRPNKNIANLNETVTYEIHIDNPTSTPAENVMLEETLPNGVEFVSGSFEVNGIELQDIDLSSKINLDNIQMQSSLFITYSVKITSIPIQNPVSNAPTLTFSYLDENNVSKNSYVKGSVIPLYIGEKPTNPCCCCDCSSTI